MRFLDGPRCDGYMLAGQRVSTTPFPILGFNHEACFDGVIFNIMGDACKCLIPLNGIGAKSVLIDGAFADGAFFFSVTSRMPAGKVLQKSAEGDLVVTIDEKVPVIWHNTECVKANGMLENRTCQCSLAKSIVFFVLKELHVHRATVAYMQDGLWMEEASTSAHIRYN